MRMPKAKEAALVMGTEQSVGLAFTFTITMEGAADDHLGPLCQYFL